MRARPANPQMRAQKEHTEHLVPLTQSCEHLRQRVGLLLETEGMVLGAPIQSRVKSWASTAAKLERQGCGAGSIFALGDLVGIRVILLYRRDIERTLELLRGEFEIAREEVKGMAGDEDAFGYQSAHAILACPLPNGAARTSASREPVLAEVQIRTLAQHIWAAASHDLQYKKEEGVPKPLRRAITRVCALLETVDLELDRVLDEREEYTAEAALAPADFKLDVDILRKVLERRLPGANRDEDEPYARLLDQLLGADIDMVSELNALIEARLADVLEREQGIVAALRSSKGKSGSARILDYSPERLERGAFYSYAGLVQKMLEGKPRQAAGRREQRAPAGRPGAQSRPVTR